MFKRTILLTHFFLIILSASFAQRNIRVFGGVKIGRGMTIDQTEVTIQEYVYFLINNDFKLELFPNDEKLPSSARVFFQDLKKGYSSSSIKREKNPWLYGQVYGVYGFEVTNKYNDFIADDSFNFSIFNPVTGVSFVNANRYCVWREEVVNATRRKNGEYHCLLGKFTIC